MTMMSTGMILAAKNKKRKKNAETAVTQEAIIAMTMTFTRIMLTEDVLEVHALLQLKR